MSELLHHGPHPDADQLSAFAEHVLPDHERLETLAHLAECAHCRQIVFLAQRAQEAQDAPPRALSGRSGWWRNWHILWPVAATLTCGFLVVVLLQRHHATDLPQRSDVAFESGALAPPSQAPPPQPVAPAVPESRPPLSPKSSGTTRAASLFHPESAAPPVGLGGVASVNGNLASNHLKSNQSGFSRDTAAADRQSTNALSAGPYSMGNATGGPVAQAPLSQEQKDSLLSDRREQSAAPQSQNQSISQQATTPRSLSEPSQSNVPPSGSQTVTVTSTPADLQTENAVVSPSIFSRGRTAQARSARSPLPSKRPAASSISNGLETLVVDSAGDLFFSKDAGMRWQRVAHQWTGKAIKVSLASPASTTQPAPSKARSAGATPSMRFEAVTPTGVAPRAGFELTTDTGAIWFSADGLIWKRQ